MGLVWMVNAALYYSKLPREYYGIPRQLVYLWTELNSPETGVNLFHFTVLFSDWKFKLPVQSCTEHTHFNGENINLRKHEFAWWFYIFLEQQESIQTQCCFADLRNVFQYCNVISRSSRAYIYILPQYANYHRRNRSHCTFVYMYCNSTHAISSMRCEFHWKNKQRVDFHIQNANSLPISFQSDSSDCVFLYSGIFRGGISDRRPIHGSFQPIQ